MPFLPTIYLIDNGSLRPEATLSLRRLAHTLTQQTGSVVEPVSLLHSNKVPADALGGEPARTVKSTLRKDLEAGQRQFICLPLFLGPSRAITEYLPELVAEARDKYPEMTVQIAESLAGAEVSQPDARLVDILVQRVEASIASSGMVNPKVALVDHGTPYRPVNDLRNAVAGQLAERLAGTAHSVTAASMERRDGPEYAFNEPLLEHLGELPQLRGGDLLVAMFFLQPGRHAGEDGDVSEICHGLIADGSFQRIVRTELMGDAPQLLEILKDRLAAAKAKLAAE